MDNRHRDTKRETGTYKGTLKHCASVPIFNRFNSFSFLPKRTSFRKYNVFYLQQKIRMFCYDDGQEMAMNKIN